MANIISVDEAFAIITKRSSCNLSTDEYKKIADFTRYTWLVSSWEQLMNINYKFITGELPTAPHKLSPCIEPSAVLNLHNYGIFVVNYQGSMDNDTLKQRACITMIMPPSKGNGKLAKYLYSHREKFAASIYVLGRGEMRSNFMQPYWVNMGNSNIVESSSKKFIEHGWLPYACELDAIHYRRIYGVDLTDYIKMNIAYRDLSDGLCDELSMLCNQFCN